MRVGDRLLRFGVHFISFREREGTHLGIKICMTAQIALKLHSIVLVS